uniref:Major facilitator superfamily MFS_1 n=1 Tax=Caulobacter sp. (strain K31) TaxID=366602 RepID=B0T943_CAUSK
MPLAVLILTLSTFALGTSEFVIMGLLPGVARDLDVSIPAAGWIVTAYALGIALGGPIMALATARMPRKRALLVLMGLFVLGNALCALSPNYSLLLLARVVTAMGQGSFFGIGAVLAASLVPDHRKATAIATMFAGLTLANVAGVPLGTALGNWAGWRAPFWAITAFGLLALVGLAAILPLRRDEEHADFIAEFRALSDGRIWAALGTTVLFTACAFPLFTYIVPMLEDVTGVSAAGVTISLLSVGVGLTLGNFLGGRLADWNLARALALIAVSIAVVSLALRWTSPYLIPAQINWFLWGAATFAAIPASQVNVMRFGQAAPNLVSTLNISAFNIGIATGAWIGGTVLSVSHNLLGIPVAAAVVAVLAWIAVLAAGRLR